MRPADEASQRKVITAVVSIIFAGIAVYANSLGGEFVFDDLDSIVENASIRSLGTAVSPPPDNTTSGRPLLNLTLAFNYAIGGHQVYGYHVVNLLIHLCAGVILFALVRGSLLRPSIPDYFRKAATSIGWVVGIMWVIHPIPTEAVSYIVQRAESLAGLFLLLTLFFLLRSASWSERAIRWYVPASRKPSQVRNYTAAAERASVFSVASVAVCTLGVMSKETAAAIPLIALLYDRAFLSGSFREAFRRRGWTYAGLFATWILLGWLILTTVGRGGTVGVASGVSSLQYAAAQSMWVLHYLRLSFWPDRLVFDYGIAVAPWGLTTQISTVLILVLLGLAIVACVKCPRVGFLPAVFFLALAPSSSFVPVITQVAAERRMYLPLAALIAIVVLTVIRLAAKLPIPVGARRWLAWVFFAVCAFPLAIQTHLRNRDYRTSFALWSDTVAKIPDSPRAHFNLGRELLAKGEVDGAIVQLRIAIALSPDEPRSHNLLGYALLGQGKKTEAITCFREVVRLDHDSSSAIANLATALHTSGQLNEAIEWYQRALDAQPESAELNYNMGRALTAVGRNVEAADRFRAAARIDQRFARMLERQ